MFETFTFPARQNNATKQRIALMIDRGALMSLGHTGFPFEFLLLTEIAQSADDWPYLDLIIDRQPGSRAFGETDRFGSGLVGRHYPGKGHQILVDVGSNCKSGFFDELRIASKLGQNGVFQIAVRQLHLAVSFGQT